MPRQNSSPANSSIETAVTTFAAAEGIESGETNELNEANGLLDGATAHEPVLTPNYEAQQGVARDPNRPVVERIEALEDIADSEIGDTTFVRARNVEREVGIRQIYLKFEGSNPTGTQKDRIAFAQVMDAVRRGFEGIAVATCGNYGVAMAVACSAAGLRCVVHIPEAYHARRIEEMNARGAEIHRVTGDYEKTVEVSRQLAAANELYDGNPGSDNTPLQLTAYGQIAHEIYDALRDAPKVIAVPVSNGTTAAGLYKGFLSLYRRGKTSRMPRVVVGSAPRKNPIVLAWLKGLENCDDLDPQTIRETVVNEPLINWHAEDGELALHAVRDTEGWAAHASDKAMRRFARLICEREGLSVLPASTAGLIALLDGHSREALANDRYVVVLTGRRS